MNDNTTRSLNQASGTIAQPGRSLLQQRKFWLLALLALVILVAVGVLIWVLTRPTEMEGVTIYPDVVAGHQEGTLTYEQSPPVGGIHSSVWQNCGIYTDPIRNENAVHTLEHGAVWITYQPDLPAEEVAQLQEAVRGKAYTLLSPYPDQSSPVVASAWGRQLALNGANDPRLQTFIDTYMQGHQAPEPGARCNGGMGEPLQQ